MSTRKLLDRGRFGVIAFLLLLAVSWSVTTVTLTSTGLFVTAFSVTSTTPSLVVHSTKRAPWVASNTALFSSSPTRLYYRDDKHDEGSSEAGGEKQKQQQPQQQQQQQNQQSQHQTPPENVESLSSSSSSSSPPPRTVWTIPVLGPFPGQAPLVLGAELTLSPPTPMQWQALEEAVLIHQHHTTNNNKDVSCVSEESDDGTLSQCCSAAGIDAAPLLAILDDATGSNPNGMLQVNGPPGRPIRARYATICAVVGMSAPDQNDNDNNNNNDETTWSNFMHRLRQTPAEQASIVDRTIRLVAIGRAAVHSFVYQIPTSSLQDTMDEEGHLILEEKNMQTKASQDEDDDDDDDDDEDDTVPPLPTNIVMAQFQLITDRTETTTSSSSSQTNAAMLPSRHASPMHALSKMSALSNQIAYLHHDRRKIVAGLQAAQARLLQRAQRQQEEQAAAMVPPIVFEEELFDYDGIGALFAQKEVATTTTTNDDDNDDDPTVLHDFLAEFGGTASSSSSSTVKEQDVLVDCSDNDDNDDNELLLDPILVVSSDEEEESTVAVGPELTIVEEEEEEKEKVDEPVSLVASLENYGMGYSASSISSIPELTQAWMEQLAPYYSPTRQQSEEHYYEVLSFVALRSMDHYLEAPHFAWAVQCTNTIERLQVVHEWMTSHVHLLKEEARRMSQQLLDCGEECTDLF